MEKEVKLPDLKLGDTFLFEDETLDKQGHTVVMIKQINDNIIIEYIPEYTPVANPRMFHYGTKKFKIIKDYQFLIGKNEIMKLPPFVMIDLIDLSNMMYRKLPLVVKWAFTKDIVITKDGLRLDKLTELFFESEYKENRPIGLVYPPVTLIEWIIRKSKLIY